MLFEPRTAVRTRHDHTTPLHTTYMLLAALRCTFNVTNHRGSPSRKHLAKVDVEGSNPFSRSKVLDAYEHVIVDGVDPSHPRGTARTVTVSFLLEKPSP